MKRLTGIRTLFLDIGGVLLTDGWGRGFRDKAVRKFGLNSEELETRHSQAADIYELGKLTLEEYLERVIFYEKRPFGRERFRQFMFAQSKPFPEMIQMVRRIKSLYELKVVVVSNEARELNDHRIKKFRLEEFVDFFISSCYVGIRKPEADIYRLALDTARTEPKRAVYIENTPMFVQVARGLGIKSLLHTDYETTRRKLALIGIGNGKGPTLAIP
jgi:putative hydrolase of the HAD superfamily